jgi:hypothetical protein
VGPAAAEVADREVAQEEESWRRKIEPPVTNAARLRRQEGVGAKPRGPLKKS